MNENLISFETANLAKEKNCNLNIGRVYCGNEEWDEVYPTQSLLQKWLREEHNIKVESLFNTLSNDYYINIVYNENNILRRFIGTYKTYEQALEVGLYEALKLIPNE